MDSIESLLAKQVQLIQQIEQFFELQSCRTDVLADLNNLQLKTGECANALQQAKQYLARFRSDLGPRYVEVIRRMRMNELLMLHLLEQLDREDGKKAAALQIQKSNVQHPEKKADSLGPKMLTVEKMTLSDYQNSPFVSKMKPRCLSFLDFNVRISQEEFEQIPKYMKGRESVDELIAFLQSVVVSCFEEKYTLLYKNKKAITNQHDLALWKAFNLQQSAFPSECC